MTHWSSRLLGRHLGISNATIAKAWRDDGVAPGHDGRVETFTFSTHPELVGKVTDVVGLYLAPAENAIVLCIDEKSQIQALDRTAPMLPMQPGLPGRRTHDYKRNGTMTLFAALEIATEKVHWGLQTAPPPSGVPRLPQAGRGPRLARCEPTDPRPQHRGLRSWLKLVEVWFGIIERQPIQGDTFGSVRDLNKKIRAFVDGWNNRCHPFVWTKTAEQILKKPTVRQLQTRATRGCTPR